jgi:hemerythrin-like domain-containing protein
MKKDIFNVMIKEHEVIESLLNEFQNLNAKNPSQSTGALQAFIWNVEKHIILEEKLLYNVYSVWDDNIDGMFEILEEHGQIMDLIKKMKRSYPDENLISQLKELLRDHFALEETLLYPSLEKVLNGKQREFLIERAQEIIRG